MRTLLEKKSIIKKIGCKIIILTLIVPPILLIGYFFYYCTLERHFIELGERDIITVWDSHIIFDRYWYPFYPKKNYIYVDSRGADYYDICFTITQDSIIGIWCSQPIKICGVDNIKGSDVYVGNERREDWEHQYDFANVTKARKDSLVLEFGYRLWYPCYIPKGKYIYKTDKGFVMKDFVGYPLGSRRL